MKLGDDQVGDLLGSNALAGFRGFLTQDGNDTVLVLDRYQVVMPSRALEVF